jgi:protein-tyrosine kinase
MSRIHDALKRAEHERDLRNAVDTELDGRIQAPTMIGMPDSGFEEEVRSRSGVLKAASFEVKSALAKCRKCDWTLDTQAMLFAAGQEQDPRAEDFRALRLRLHQAREKQHLRSLLVTSAMDKEGKSFVAANLAQALALQSQSWVLLIDADLRNSQLHKLFGTSATPGLSDYLREGMDEFTIMQRGPTENLFLIPAGGPYSGPTELVANGRMEDLITKAEALFDWIIVDSPSAIAVSDACSLSTYCDGVLMVVRSQSTPFPLVRKARNRFREGSLVGVVLNGTEHNSSPKRRRSNAAESAAI